MSICLYIVYGWLHSTLATLNHCSRDSVPWQKNSLCPLTEKFADPCFRPLYPTAYWISVPEFSRKSVSHHSYFLPLLLIIICPFTQKPQLIAGGLCDPTFHKSILCAAASKISVTFSCSYTTYCLSRGCYGPGSMLNTTWWGKCQCHAFADENNWGSDSVTCLRWTQFQAVKLGFKPKFVGVFSGYPPAIQTVSSLTTSPVKSFSDELPSEPNWDSSHPSDVEFTKPPLHPYLWAFPSWHTFPSHWVCLGVTLASGHILNDPNPWGFSNYSLKHPWCSCLCHSFDP